MTTFPEVDDPTVTARPRPGIGAALNRSIDTVRALVARGEGGPTDGVRG